MELYLQAETTGKLSHRGHIIEAAAVVLDESRREIASFEILANPGDEILRDADPVSMAAHRITHEDLAGAMRSEQAATELDAFLERFRAARLHSFNNETARILFTTSPWHLGSRPWGDSVRSVAAEVMLRSQALDHAPKLTEAMKFFGLPFAGPHRALALARAVAKLHTQVMEYCDENDLSQDEAFHIFEHGL